MRILIALTIAMMLGCSVHRHARYHMPYLNSIEESKRFTDSLVEAGVEYVLVYHKKHGFSPREYYVFWKNDSVEVRRIMATGIHKLNSWKVVGLYRDDRLFTFYKNNRQKLFSDSIPPAQWSHYPYSDIEVTTRDTTLKLHLPNGINSPENTVPYHFARLIESTIFNITKGTVWISAERPTRYYPRAYDPTKEKWRDWKQEKMREGELWDDYFH